jgi:IS5 family transposase
VVLRAEGAYGADRDSGLVHTVVTTAANVSDVTQTHALLHGKEKSVFADAGYTDADKREALKGKRINWPLPSGATSSRRCRKAS